MTASITEALRIARGYVADDVKRKPSGYDPSSDLRVIDAALASLSCGEARERIARIIDPNAGWGVKLDSDYLDLRQEQAKMEDEQRVALRKADAILATGCVPGEASIRADEMVRVAAEAIYNAWAKNHEVEATWDECVRLHHSIVREAEEEARAALTAAIRAGRAALAEKDKANER